MELPKGLSISATIGNILWGAGDHRASVIQSPLSKQEVESLKTALTELFEYARQKASSRHLPTSKHPFGMIGYDGVGYPVNLTEQSYNGSGGSSVFVPPAGAEFDKEAAKAIKKGVNDAVDQLQRSLRFQQEARSQMGP